MNILLERAKRREELVRIAKDSNVNKLAELFLAKYRSDLEHLQDGDHIEEHVPVGKEKFTDWLKEQIASYFPTLSGLVENERTLKDYAGQVADAISKSNTGVQNPLRDYKVSKDPIFVKAQTSPAEPSVPAQYLPPTEVFRTNEDREQIIPKDLEQGVQNQNLMNTMHPIKPFLSKEKGPTELRLHEKKNKELYDVFKDNEDLISPSAPNNDPKTMEESKKEASSDLLSKLTRKAKDGECAKCGMKNCPCMKEGKECKCKPKTEAKTKTKTAQQLFGPTTMSTRQCPDHPGQQMTRLADGMRQCPLDGKTYDFVRGFTTENGVKHNGGSVQAQGSIPPGSIIVRLDRKASKTVEAMDTPKTHAFLYQILQLLPAEARERSILNYKFSHNMSLEEAIAKFEEAERLAVQQKAQQPQKG